MKKAVMIITGVAVMMIAAGGSALDSQNVMLPMSMIAPAVVWLGLIAWVNR